MEKYDVIVVGSGNAALCAGISALENGAKVLMVEQAPFEEMGGNSRYTAGAMRFAYNSFDDLKPLLLDPSDERLANCEFGSYTKEKFLADLEHFNEGQPITELQQFLVDQSLSVVNWLASHNVKFVPSYARQSFVKDGKRIFWGGIAVDTEGEGDGMVQLELKEYIRLGGEIWYDCAAEKIVQAHGHVAGLQCKKEGKKTIIPCKTVVLGCGGFEANKQLRIKYLGKKWAKAKVRGTRHNLGKGIEIGTEAGAALNGFFGGCHAVPMDRYMPEYGNLDIPHVERKQYRKISYLYGVMLNSKGKRFVDEGMDMRNYTYAQFGKAVLEQPHSIAYQIFDAKVADYLYAEYRVHHASFVQADTLEALIEKLPDIDKAQALKTLQDYNKAALASQHLPFDPTIKDGKKTVGLRLPKSNWATLLDTPPFKAYAVTSGITFTYGGLKVNTKGEVLQENGQPVSGLFACGEIVGGVFFHGYPGGSGLTSGAVFGRAAGRSAAQFK